MNGRGIFKKFEIFKSAKIKQQLYFIYFVAIFLPITIIGTFLLTNTSKLLTNYHRDLLESDNLRVKTILFEITTQVYNISEEIAFDEPLRDFLAYSFYIRANMVQRASEISVIDNYSNNYAEIDGIEVYTDSPTAMDYKQFYKATDEVKNSEWFQRASNQSSVFWYPMMSTDKHGNEYWNLCLVRKIPLRDVKYHAVLVIKVSDNYLKTRINSQEYASMVSLDEQPIFYSSDRSLYGTNQPIEINYDEPYFEYAGTLKKNGVHSFVELTTLHTYQSDSNIYICTMNDQAYSSIRNIILICLLIIAVAVLLPGIIIHYFTEFFTSRVLTLRHAMHQAMRIRYLRQYKIPLIFPENILEERFFLWWWLHLRLCYLCITRQCYSLQLLLDLDSLFLPWHPLVREYFNKLKKNLIL